MPAIVFPADPPDASLPGPMIAVELLGRLGVDQIHRALRQLVLREQRVVGLGDHVDDGVADRGDVELVRCSCQRSSSIGWGQTPSQCV